MSYLLLIGDFHIPTRAFQIPEKFKQLLVPQKIKTILCTGNLCTKETYDYLKSITSDLHCVKGDFDGLLGPDIALPETEIVEIEGFKIGIIHGHQIVPWNDRDALAMLQRRMDVDILVFGNTHHYDAFEMDGKLFINPGTATGAFSTTSPEKAQPSFMVMIVQKTKVSCFIYKADENGNTLPVEKKVFNIKKGQ